MESVFEYLASVQWWVWVLIVLASIPLGIFTFFWWVSGGFNQSTAPSQYDKK